MAVGCCDVASVAPDVLSVFVLEGWGGFTPLCPAVLSTLQDVISWDYLTHFNSLLLLHLSSPRCALLSPSRPEAPLASQGAASVLCNSRKRGNISMFARGMAPVGSEVVPGPVQACEQALGRGSGEVELLRCPSLAAESFEAGSAVL